MAVGPKKHYDLTKYYKFELLALAVGVDLNNYFKLESWDSAVGIKKHYDLNK